MSFAELVSDMTGVLFSDAGFGETATYTAPVEGAVAKDVRVVLDEPNENPFPRESVRSNFKERVLSAWLWRLDAVGSSVTFATGGRLVITTSAGVVRTVDLVSPQDADPDRVQWAVREVTA